MSDNPIFDRMNEEFSYNQLIASMKRIELTAIQSVTPTYRLAVGVPFSTEADESAVYFRPSYWREGAQEPRTGTGKALSALDSTWLSKDVLDEAEDDEDFFRKSHMEGMRPRGVIVDEVAEFTGIRGLFGPDEVTVVVEADSSNFQKSVEKYTLIADNTQAIEVGVQKPVVTQIPREVKETYPVDYDQLLDGIDMVRFTAGCVDDFQAKYPGVENVTVVARHNVDFTRDDYKIVVTGEYMDEPLRPQDAPQRALTGVLTPLEALQAQLPLAQFQVGLKSFRDRMLEVAENGGLNVANVFKAPFPSYDTIDNSKLAILEEHSTFSYEEVMGEIHAQMLKNHPGAVITALSDVKKEDDGSLSVSVEAMTPDGVSIEVPMFDDGTYSEE